MVELARKTPTMIQEFMNQANGFINTEDTLQALIASRKFELEQVKRNPNSSRRTKALERHKKGQECGGRDKTGPLRGLGAQHA